MITLEQYWMGRDKLYASSFDDSILQNGKETVKRVNMLLKFAELDGIDLTNVVASGWRPAAVNEATSNAAGHSKHITAQACDIRDNSNRDLARWCCLNEGKLELCGLWMERFEWTPTWCHFGIVPPASGKRFYIPSTAPALVARLPEQEGVC